MNADTRQNIFLHKTKSKSDSSFLAGTNDAFVTISLGKEKFQTSVREKSGPQAEWSEQCEL